MKIKQRFANKVHSAYTSGYITELRTLFAKYHSHSNWL
jgi:hypothetical protein